VFSQSVWDGTANTDWYNASQNEFTITTAEQLAGLAQLVNDGNSFENKTVILANDIDLGNKNWTPIGGNSTTAAKGFWGVFDGNGKTISNLTITGNFLYTGLFGGVGTNGQIKNLTVNVKKITVTAVATDAYKTLYFCVGGLAGSYASSKAIENCGVNITDSIRSSISVSNNADAWSYCGGLVGNGRDISNSYTTGNVSAYVSGATTSGDAWSYCGGLAGTSGNISDSYTTGNIFASVSNSSTRAEVPGGAVSYCGGLVGEGGDISNSHAIGRISASATSATSVASGSHSYCGGLAGISGNISDSYATSTTSSVSISAYSWSYCGGLVGQSEDISNSHATGNASASATSSKNESRSHCGGLVGEGRNISNSHATGNASASATTNPSDYAWSYCGGLVGEGKNISNSYATGNAYAPAKSGNSNYAVSYCGGLVGSADRYTNSYITGSYATGNAEGYKYAGGLVGSGGNMTNCYATGNVNMVGVDIVVNTNNISGALVGYGGNMTNCYATGRSIYGTFGGLSGVASSSITNSYYDKETSGKATGKGAKTTAEMKQKATYVAWDFDEIWNIDGLTNGGYPFLRAFVPALFNIVFLNGGVEYKNMSVEKNKNVSAPTIPTKTGFVFDGWYIGDVLFDFSTTITTDLILTAKWAPIEYAITYHYNGGDESVSNPQTFTVESANLAINPTTKDGYVFDGWFANANLSGKAITSIPASSTGDKEFWAKWTPNNANPIRDRDKHKHDNRHGILLEKAVVSQPVKISLKTPEQAQINLAIYDNAGNVLYKTSGKNTDTFVWNLTNSAGRNVANGSYLIVAQAKGAKGSYAYSAKVGVRR